MSDPALERVIDLFADPGRDALIDGVLASAAIPGVFEPVTLQNSTGSDGDYFVDAGVREVLPLQAAYESGPDLVIGISAGTPLAEDPGQFDTILPILGRTLKIIGEDVESNDLAVRRFAAYTAPLCHVAPDFEVHDALTVDPGLIRINMAYGYMRAYLYYMVFTGRLNQASIGAVLAFILILDIIQRRKDVWNMEVSALKSPNSGTYFDAPALKRIRELKRQIMKDTEGVFFCLGNDPTSVPLAWSVDSGDGECIHDWWNKWEHHGPNGFIFDQFDLWQPLPVGPGPTWAQPFESIADVGSKPVSSVLPPC